MPEEESGCPPRPRPCPRTGHCFPHPQAGRDPRVCPWPARDVAHSQSFGAKVWDEGELADFQELRLPRKTKAQGRDSGFQPLRPHGPGSSAPPGGLMKLPPLKPAPGPYHGVVVAVERHGQEAVEVILQVFLKQGQETDTDGTGAMGARNAFPGGPASGRTCLLDACLEEPSGPARGREGISRLAASPAGGWVVAKLRRRGGKRVRWEPGS